MQLRTFAERCNEPKQLDGDRYRMVCPLDPAHTLIARRAGDRVVPLCLGGCAREAILAVLQLTEHDLRIEPQPQTPPAIERNGTAERLSSNGRHAMLAPIDVWRFRVAKVVEADCENAHELTYQNTDPEKLIDSATSYALGVIRQAGLLPPEDTDMELEVRNIATGVVQGYLDKYDATLPATTNGHAPPMVLPIHDFALAELATEEYLQRIPVVEGLFYSSATSMVTGGKHAGKSTLMRWLAICVAKGLPFLGREVQQGPVIYLASEDEELPAMSELRRLGWTRSDPIMFLPKSKIPDEMDEQAVLRLLADKVQESGAVMVAVDMLFDFIPVSDELAYAGTRRATGMLQKVASTTGCHIVCVHHAPKHTSKNAEVTVTALGSMGLAARVSPMVLVVRWAHGVHTIETSDVRDPRGKPIEKMRLVQAPDGSLALGNNFREYMLASAYADQVFDVIAEEPGQEFTVRDVMEVCELDSFKVARATLRFLYNAGKIGRAGQPVKGKGYRYFIPLTDPQQLSDANGSRMGAPIGDAPILSTDNFESQGRFGYKEN